MTITRLYSKNINLKQLDKYLVLQPSTQKELFSKLMQHLETHISDKELLDAYEKVRAEGDPDDIKLTTALLDNYLIAHKETLILAEKAPLMEQNYYFSSIGIIYSPALVTSDPLTNNNDSRRIGTHLPNFIRQHAWPNVRRKCESLRAAGISVTIPAPGSETRKVEITGYENLLANLPHTSNQPTDQLLASVKLIEKIPEKSLFEVTPNKQLERILEVAFNKLQETRVAISNLTSQILNNRPTSNSDSTLAEDFQLFQCIGLQLGMAIEKSNNLIHAVGLLLINNTQPNASTPVNSSTMLPQHDDEVKNYLKMKTSEAWQKPSLKNLMGKIGSKLASNMLSDLILENATCDLVLLNLVTSIRDRKISLTRESKMKYMEYQTKLNHIMTTQINLRELVIQASAAVLAKAPTLRAQPTETRQPLTKTASTGSTTSANLFVGNAQSTFTTSQKRSAESAAALVELSSGSTLQQSANKLRKFTIDALLNPANALPAPAPHDPEGLPSRRRPNT